MKISDDDFFKKAIETSVRFAALVLLSYGCYQIFKPFFIPFIWGVIIAVGVNPLFRGLKKIVRGNKIAASSILVILLFSFLALPAFLLTKSFIEGATSIANSLEGQSIVIPPPTETVKTWPMIGPKLFIAWEEISTNLTNALIKFAPQLKPIGLWVLNNLTKLGLEIIFFIIAILVAGILLVFEENAKVFLHKLAARLSGESGEELVHLAGSTVRNVTQGIIGVALIQSILAGVALLLADVPHAGLWSFLTLIILVIQIPIFLTLGPIALYLFSYSETHIAVIFLVWAIILSVIDTPLRALFFGRGATTPMPIIFFGAIGGMIQFGIIGLFIGAVVLALGYRFFLFWLKNGDAD